MRKFLSQLIFNAAAMAVFLPKVSFAYIDPGTGSYFIQILAAVIFGASFALRFTWRRISRFFKRIFGADSASGFNGAQKNEKRNSDGEKDK